MMIIVDFPLDSRLNLSNQLWDSLYFQDNFQKLREKYRKIIKGKIAQHLNNKIIIKILSINIMNDFK